MSGQLQTLNTPPPVSVQTLLYGIYQATSSGSGGSTAWGSITGTLSNQTDLQTALNLKTNNAAAAITGGSVTGLTSFGLANADASGYGLFFQVNEVLSSPRVLSLKTNNANRTLDLSGNLTLGGNFTTTGSGTIALGGFTLTVPATGTAALLGVANTFTAAQTVSGGTVTVSTPLLDLSQTWNAGAVAFTGIKANYTATAAAATSMLMDLQVGGTSKFKVVANSATAGTQVIFSGNGASTTITQAASEVSFNNGFSATLRFGLGNTDTSIVGQGCPIQLANYGDNPFKFAKNVNSVAVTFVVAVDAADVFALRNASAAQTLRVYGTYTDASNYRRLAIGSTTAGVFSITAEGAGTGASGNVLHISSLPTSNPGPGILWNNAGTPAIGT
jgi:hypothetical protein